MVCARGKILNALTGRCVNRDGAIGKVIIRNIRKHYGPTDDYYNQEYFEWPVYYYTIDNSITKHQPDNVVRLLMVDGCREAIETPTIQTAALSEFEAFIFNGDNRL